MGDVSGAPPRPCDRVLVLDDDADMLSSIGDVLELEGVDARTATSAAEADAILAGGFDPDAVVIDVRLGSGERGDAYARRLQASGAHAGTPFVLMSGDVHELRRVEAHADATLMKPFPVERLLEVLSRVCTERARHRRARA